MAAGECYYLYNDPAWSIPPPPNIDPWRTNGSLYSYDPPCATTGDEIDPVTTVFTWDKGKYGSHNLHVTYFDVRLTDDAGWGSAGHPITGGDDLQHFLAFDTCVEGEITRATNGGWESCTDPGWPPFHCSKSRWHVRCDVNSLGITGDAVAFCTPHWDQEFDSDPKDECWHFVPALYGFYGDEDYEGSGFSAARDRLWWDLVQEEGYWFRGRVHWHNIHLQRQCNDDLTQSDGDVNFIDFRYQN